MWFPVLAGHEDVDDGVDARGQVDQNVPNNRHQVLTRVIH